MSDGEFIAQAVIQPRCIRCDGRMGLAGVEPKGVFGYRYELRTFRCERCDHPQTYTMGRST
jgi:hypothetical protein